MIEQQEDRAKQMNSKDVHADIERIYKESSELRQEELRQHEARYATALSKVEEMHALNKSPYRAEEMLARLIPPEEYRLSVQRAELDAQLNKIRLKNDVYAAARDTMLLETESKRSKILDLHNEYMERYLAAFEKVAFAAQTVTNLRALIATKLRGSR